MYADQNALGNIYSCTVLWPKAAWTGNSTARVIKVKPRELAWPAD